MHSGSNSNTAQKVAERVSRVLRCTLHKIPTDTIQTLVENLPRRVETVIAVKEENSYINTCGFTDLVDFIVTKAPEGVTCKRPIAFVHICSCFC